MTDNSSEPKEPRLNTPSASSKADMITVEKAVGGDQVAFKQLFDKYRHPLYFHVLRMVHNRDIIEDLLQEILLKAFDNIHTYNPDYAFSTWLYRITTNHSIDYLRKKRLKTYSIDQPIMTKDGEMSIEVMDHDSTSDDHVTHNERAAVLKKALDSLPEKYKQIIYMRHMDELSYQEIADILQLPLGTVKALIFRARELLYKALKDREGTF